MKTEKKTFAEGREKKENKYDKKKNREMINSFFLRPPITV